jgi:hypothetical protein
MAAVKQRIDQLREDPDTVRVVKEQKGKERLAVLTQENQIQAAEEKRAIAILSSLDPKSEEYKREKQRFKDNNLGEAVKKVEKAAQEAETAKRNYEKLLADVRPTALTKEQKALGEKYGASFQEGTSRQIILANREILKSTLKQVSEMGTELALQDMKPLDEPAAKAVVQKVLYELKEEGDLPFSRDFLQTDLEERLRDLSDEDQQYLINSAIGKEKPKAQQLVFDFIQEKFPDEFEGVVKQKEREARAAQDRAELESAAKEVIALGLASDMEEAIRYIENETSNRIASKAIARGNIN